MHSFATLYSNNKMNLMNIPHNNAALPPTSNATLATAHTTIDCPDPVALIYDGTIEGLMSAVFAAWELHHQVEDVLSQEYGQIRLGQQVVVIETDFEKAQRVKAGLQRRCGVKTWRTIAQAACADGADVGTIVYQAIRRLMGKNGAQALNEAADPTIAALLKLARHVEIETEHMRQFMRFSQADDGLWYAVCNPNASVVPLVMNFFAARFNTQRFIIYDEVHHLAGISEDGSWELVRINQLNVPAPNEHEALMQDAWKHFYRSATIEARYHPELRRHFMPMRLWKHITELHENVEERPSHQRKE